jgi:hypothetical protein
LEEQLITKINRFERGIQKKLKNTIKYEYKIESIITTISIENIVFFYFEFDKNFVCKSGNNDSDENFIKNILK